jgi:hypothetical protein
MRYRRFLTVAIGCLFNLGCGSSSSDSQSLPAPDSGTTSGPTANEELDSLGLFESELLKQVGLLQLGVDLSTEDDLQACMMQEGFDYVPRSMAELAQRLGIRSLSATDKADDQSIGTIADHFSSAQFALASLSGDSAEPNPNQGNLASLSEEEQAAWNETYSGCLVRASEGNLNPLAAQGDWFAAASEEASQRAGASAEVVEANVLFERCFTAFGYGDVDEVQGKTYDEVQLILEKLEAGTASIEVTRQELKTVASLEQEMSRAFESCDEPNRDVVGRVYRDELRAIAERDSDKASVWASEFGELVASYLERLDSGG